MISKSVKFEREDYGKKWVILGKSGSGKSHSARVAIEEGLELGVTFTVIDPQSAYENLPGFHYVIAKKVSDPAGFGLLCARTARNVVINTKGMTINEQADFVHKFLKSYRANSRKGIRTIVIDECHKFAPEYEKVSSKEEVRSMSQENRSDGLGFIAVEQRTQRLDKTVLSQADYLMIHKMTSKRDLMAIEGYLDDPKSQLEQIKKLRTGEALFNGFQDDPIIEMVRKAKTEHSGSAPKTLLTEDMQGYHKHIRSVYKGRGGNMPDESVSTKGEPIKGFIPSMGGFKDLAKVGMKLSLGMGGAAFVGQFANRLPAGIPYVSNRTLASAATTVVMYAGYRHVKNDVAKDVLFYGAAGAGVHTLGSAVYDVLAAFKVQPPSLVNFALFSMTGVPPMMASTAAVPTSGEAKVDLNTNFA